MSELAEKLIEEFGDKDYAHAYMEEHGNMALAAQIKTIRELRGLTQEQLAELAGMKQERISALENVDYDAWTIKTLRKLARAFDTHLNVAFVPFSKGILDVANMSRDRLNVSSRENDLNQLRQRYIVNAGGKWKALDGDHLTNVKRMPVRNPVAPIDPLPTSWQLLCAGKR